MNTDNNTGATNVAVTNQTPTVAPATAAPATVKPKGIQGRKPALVLHLTKFLDKHGANPEKSKHGMRLSQADIDKAVQLLTDLRPRAIVPPLVVPDPVPAQNAAPVAPATPATVVPANPETTPVVV